MLAKTETVPPTSSATKFIRINKTFSLFRGGVLPGLEIAYEHWGKLSAARDNAVLLFTGLSPSAHATSSMEDRSPGWWEYMVGPGKPIDTERFFVICVNSLGSCFGSTGPASINPESGQLYRLNFPELAVEDIANAGMEVVRALQIDRLHTVVGASLGGMSALALAIMHPHKTTRLVAISAAGHATPFATAIRSLQREIIRKDPKWNQGDYEPDDQPTEGMRIARKLGLITYRSPQEYTHRFGRKKISKTGPSVPPFAAEFDVESYLEYNASNFIHQFDTNCYLYLSRAIDWFDIALHGGSIAAGLAEIRTRSNLIIGVTTDFLFPVHQQKEIADTLANRGLNTTYEELPSIQGHDSFLIDEEHFAPVVNRFFVES